MFRDPVFSAERRVIRVDPQGLRATPPGPPGRDYRNRFAANQNMETKQGGRDDHDRTLWMSVPEYSDA